MGLPVIQPSRVTVMIKPVGALCNLDCHYCYYLPTKTIYDGHQHRMSLDTLESIYASVLPRFHDDVTIAWQGGEPTLAGLPFFRRALEYQKKYARPSQRIHHALQTNGTLLDDEWCKFLHDNEFLIGLSVDGPPRFHDHYRLTNRGTGSSDHVLRGMRLLQKHAVEYNILCVLNDINVHHPDEVMGYLLNLGSRWLQFIPAIEWEKHPTEQGHNVLAAYSPQPADYGKFLCRAFDLWFEKYRKRVSVRIFDAVLNKLVLGQMPFCILDGACHNQLTIEHDGAVFGCDHFVERRWQLAQIGESDWRNNIGVDGSVATGLTIHGDGYQKLDSHDGRDIDGTADFDRKYAPQDAESEPQESEPRGVSPRSMEEQIQTKLAPGAAGADSHALSLPPSAGDAGWYDRIDEPRLGSFAVRKQDLPAKCKACQWKPYCHGGCPKHREHGGDVPEPTILCESYMMFYEHAMPRLNWLAGFLRQNRQPPDPEPARQPPAAVAAGGGGGDAEAGNAGTPRNPGTPGVLVGAAVGEAEANRQGLGDTRSLRAKPHAAAAAPGRNDPCPCGSGLKFKKCHGRNH